MTFPLTHLLSIENDRFFLWFPVSIGFGILWYFSLSHEPSFGMVVGLGTVLCLLVLCVLWSVQKIVKVLGWGLAGVLLGFLATFYRAHMIHSSMLEHPTGMRRVEGTLVSIEHTPHVPSRIRLILSELDIKPPLCSDTPQTIRVVLRGEAPHLFPGDRVRLRVKLMPVSQAVSPVCGDLARQAFFKGIGATGFALTKPKLIRTMPLSKNYLWVNRIRHAFTQHFLTNLPHPLGSIAAALITGDTAVLPQKVRQDFANSGMSHILAISGLHLSIVAGFVFLVVRRGGALLPFFSLRFPLHKYAALSSILMTFLYLILSGEGVPAKRSFVMTTGVMGAILLDRPVIALRMVAIAAIAVLLTTPEALLGASFQLSFAAVISLIACYEIAHDLKQRQPRLRSFSKIVAVLLYGLNAAFSSLIASFATTPFAMVFFHQATLQAIVSNMCAIPLVTFVIMPLAVVMCLSTLVRLDAFILPVFSSSLQGLLWIAETVSDWPGALIKIPIGAPWGLGFFVMGGLWLCLWKSWIRWGGVVVMGIGFWGLLIPHVPHFWMDAESKLIGFFDHTTSILWVSSLKREIFAQTLWAHAAGAKGIQEFPPEGPLPFSWPFQLQCCVTWTGTLPSQPPLFDLILSLKPLKPEERLRGRVIIDALDIAQKGACALWIQGPRPQEVKVSYTHANVARPWIHKLGGDQKEEGFKK